MTQSPYKPTLHFSPKTDWMNDPNGPIFINGWWHLFFQKLSPRHWGHARSRDLFVWEELPIAISPCSGADHEEDEVFSGGTVYSSGVLTAIFTSRINYSDKPYEESQRLAVSKDQGMTFTRLSGLPVLPPLAKSQDSRDPKVFWHQPSLRWIMILATGPTVSIFSSTDLHSWTFCSELQPNPTPSPVVTECPDLFQLGDPSLPNSWVITCSWLIEWCAGEQDCARGMCYAFGEFDGSQFIASTGWIPYGFGDDYAAITWSLNPESPEKQILIGWMDNWTYADCGPTTTCMTLPRLLTRGGTVKDPLLLQKPLPSLPLNCTVIQVTEKSISIPISTIDRIKIVGSLDTKQPLFPRDITFTIENKPFLVLRLNYHGKILEIDRSMATPPDHHQDFSRLILVPLSDKLIQCLEIIIDISAIDIFINEGERYAALRAYQAM